MGFGYECQVGVILLRKRPPPPDDLTKSHVTHLMLWVSRIFATNPEKMLVK